MRKLRSRVSAMVFACGIVLAASAIAQQAAIGQTKANEAAAPFRSSDQVPAEVQVAPETTARRVPPRPGDVCMVCNQPIHDGDVVFSLRGHRIPIHLAELELDLRSQLLRLLGKKQPHGAFLGAGPEERPLSWGWFLVGIYVLLGLVFAAASAHRAFHAGRNALAWFFIGLVLNIAGWLLLLLQRARPVEAPAGVPAGLSKIARTRRPEICPRCGAPNHPSAERCSACGGALAPKIVSEVARAGLARP
jgi:ribosomal protein L40E